MAGSTANSIKEMVSNESLSRGSFMDGSKRGKSVLIMDEVDGMSGGDRGGVSDLIASIKISKIPIICICNDRYNQKLKSLVNYCLPLNFRKPTKQQMAKRLCQVAELEGLKVDEAALLELGERVNGDMRMALNQLQYMSLSSSILKYADIKARLQGSKKDEDITPFTAVDKLLGYEGGRLRMDERMDLSMSDPDLVPLLIQENYLNYKPSAASRDGDGSLRMDLIARAAESIADGDIINVQIRRYRQWQHSQMGAFASSIIPAAFMHGPREVLVQGERNFNRFGGWLGKNSTLGKNNRLLEDVHVHFLASGTCEPTRGALRLDYLPLLVLQLTRPLQTLPKEEAVQTVVEFMNEYSLNQEDFDTIVELSKFQGHPDPLDGIQPAVKAALTKAYKQNEKSHRVRSSDLLPAILLPGQKKTPKSKRVASLLATVDEYPLENKEDEPAEDEEDSSDEDDFEASALKDGKLQLSLEDNKSKGIEIKLDIKNKGNANANSSKAKQSKARAEKETGTKGAKRKR
jgi:replication factor C subunit 1